MRGRYFQPKYLIVCFIFCFASFYKITAQSERPGGLWNIPSSKAIDTALVNKTIKTGRSYFKKGELDTSLMYMRQAKQLARAINYKPALARCYNYEGMVLYRRGKYLEALDSIKSGLRIAQEIGDSIIQSSSLNYIGNVYSGMGNDVKALDYYFKGLAIEEKLRVPLNLHWYYNNIGSLYLFQKNYSKALEYCFKAIEVEEKLTDKSALTLTHSNIGDIYLQVEKNDSALFYYTLSLKEAERSKDNFNIANSLKNLSTFNIKLKQFSKAREFSIRSSEICKEQDFKDLLADNLNNLGVISNSLKQPAAAECYFIQALDISKSIGSKSLIKQSFFALATFYEEMQDYKKAHYYYKLFSETKDSLLNEENSRLITEMNTRYATEKKENEILLLTKDKQLNTKIIRQQQLLRWLLIAAIILLFIAVYGILKRYRFKQKQNRILEEQLSEKFAQLELKTLQAQINPHFTFNCLNSISYFINSNQNEEASIYLNKFSKLLRLYIEHSRSLFVELEEEASLLTLYCELENLRFRKPFDFKLQIDEDVKKKKIFVPSMIFQLFVENAINHGLRYINRSGYLFIGFQLCDGILQIIITDDGVGRKASEEINQKKTKGHISRGLTLTNERIKIINSMQRLNISVLTEDLFPDKEETGTKVVINFPL